MKKTFNEMLKFLGSRLVYFLIGLSFSVVVIAVNAAVTISTTPASTGETLTSAKWNAMVNDLNNIKNEMENLSLGYAAISNVAGSRDHNTNVGPVNTDCYRMQSYGGQGWITHVCNTGYVLVGMQISMGDSWSGTCCRLSLN